MSGLIPFPTFLLHMSFGEEEGDLKTIICTWDLGLGRRRKQRINSVEKCGKLGGAMMLMLNPSPFISAAFQNS
jgi:hypothetical protein